MVRVCNRNKGISEVIKRCRCGWMFGVYIVGIGERKGNKEAEKWAINEKGRGQTRQLVTERGSRDNTEKVTSDKEKCGRKVEIRVRAKWTDGGKNSKNEWPFLFCLNIKDVTSENTKWRFTAAEGLHRGCITAGTHWLKIIYCYVLWLLCQGYKVNALHTRVCVCVSFSSGCPCLTAASFLYSISVSLSLFL